MFNKRRNRWLPKRAHSREYQEFANLMQAIKERLELMRRETYSIGVDFGLESKAAIVVSRRNPDGSVTMVAEKIVDIPQRKLLGYDRDHKALREGDTFETLTGKEKHVADGVSAAGFFVTSKNVGYPWSNVRRVEA